MRQGSQKAPHTVQILPQALKIMRTGVTWSQWRANGGGEGEGIGGKRGEGINSLHSLWAKAWADLHATGNGQDGRKLQDARPKNREVILESVLSKIPSIPSLLTSGQCTIQMSSLQRTHTNLSRKRLRAAQLRSDSASMSNPAHDLVAQRLGLCWPLQAAQAPADNTQSLLSEDSQPISNWSWSPGLQSLCNDTLETGEDEVGEISNQDNSWGPNQTVSD
ncbi:hypothetical protein TREMEDRAFT_60408 [Tremella mesenterica DSM 1558]|uniref:uncharacterized protein n=1 Tax=Tremella mesenterica (strain ATCC 24925 / CBS 8224 / DSM 1558 / NBRC 9311 / NRRL Y-6157 / RJB 2259-6 / UBC 559-6) TaxID=578456 RepID=UPI0003F490C1|nr:uncharacterized protein TREMEDRAFT_60408 [Tremella mesenterica DSM 1558]EIW71482.1 hypothetical protein TREMEDRAFT_60408 [Tremella mesenterica DSM 1558]